MIDVCQLKFTFSPGICFFMQRVLCTVGIINLGILDEIYA